MHLREIARVRETFDESCVWYVATRPGEGRGVEMCLGEWTPRNIAKRAPAVVADAMEAALEALKNVLVPRLFRVLAPFAEARAAVVAMFLDMHRQGVSVSCPG